MKKEKTTQELPKGVYMCENLGILYKEVKIPDFEKLTGEEKEEEDIPTKSIKLYNSNKPERLEGETYQEYRIRRKLVNDETKSKLRGSFLWFSKSYHTPESFRNIGEYIEAMKQLNQGTLNYKSKTI